MGGGTEDGDGREWDLVQKIVTGVDDFVHTRVMGARHTSQISIGISEKTYPWAIIEKGDKKVVAPLLAMRITEELERMLDNHGVNRDRVEVEVIDEKLTDKLYVCCQWYRMKTDGPPVVKLIE